MPNDINIEPGACGLPGCTCQAAQAAARADEEALAEGAAAGDTTADPAPDEDGEDTCENCGDDASDCGCFTCSPGMRREHLATSDTCNECCGRCDEHCECQQCPGCDRRNPDLTLCSVCDHCDSRCCDCRYCESCGENHHSDTDWCSECDVCLDQCSCSGDDSDDPDEHRDGVRGDSPRMFSYPLVFHRGRPARALPSSRFAAVEIEVQGCSSAAHRGDGSLGDLASKKWSFSVVRDGSLGSYGFEINTAPASGTAFIEQVNDICRVLNDNAARVDRACGLHIHLDGRGLTPVEVLRFTRLSNAIRDAITMVLPPSRHAGGNSYCIPYPSGFERTLSMWPLGDTYDSRFVNLAKAVYGGSGDEHARDSIRTMPDVAPYASQKYAGNRYWWINLHSWFHRGTIEVRSHSGTTSPRKIVMWAAFWCALVDRVCRMTDMGAATLIEAAARDPWRVFLRLCPTPDVARYYAARRETFDRVGYRVADDTALTEEVAAMETPVKRGLNIININSIITDTE